MNRNDRRDARRKGQIPLPQDVAEFMHTLSRLELLWSTIMAAHEQAKLHPDALYHEVEDGGPKLVGLDGKPTGKRVQLVGVRVPPDFAHMLVDTNRKLRERYNVPAIELTMPGEGDASSVSPNGDDG